MNSSSGTTLSERDKNQLLKKFERPYQEFGDFDFWLVPGNHDWYGDIQFSIYYTLESQRWKMPYNHYEIPWLPNWIRFYGLDTTRIEYLDYESGLVKEQMESANKSFNAKTMEEDLNDSFCGFHGWKVIFGHHGIYTSGRHGKVDSVNVLKNLNPFRKAGVNRYMKEKLFPFFKKCRAHLFLVGHDHHQEHLKAYSAKGKKTLFHQIIQGAAGKLRSVNDVDHPEFKSLFKRAWFGFSILTFTPESIKIRFFGYPKGHPEKYSKIYESLIKFNEYQ